MLAACGMLHTKRLGLVGREMADPLTLAAVGAVALTEGIKFLYGQAGETLKRWRESKGTKAATATVTEPVQVKIPSDAFEGRCSSHD